MAAAEARAAWQRSVNRYFVQEDAKRAPKLACCSSSSSNSPSNGETPATPDHSASKAIPLNWNPASSNLPPDTTWWLQLQPNFACPKDFMHEQLSALDSKLDGSREGEQVPNSRLSEGSIVSENSNSDPKERMFATCVKHEPETGGPMSLKAMHINPQQSLTNKGDMCDFYRDEDLMDWKPLDHIVLKKHDKNFTDLETPWLGSEKVEPWWRAADKSELASLVAQKSLEHIENCDLPRPRKMNIQQSASIGLECFGKEGLLPLVLDQKVDGELIKQVDYYQQDRMHENVDGNNWSSGEISHSVRDLDNFSSCRTNSCSSTACNNANENMKVSGSEPSKAQLLEALRHSQTRAREAEKAAQQAYTEKEHIVKLFFRQASQLFAYKQWIHLLQLESLCLQLKSKDSQVSTLFPGLPWMPLKVRQLRRAARKGIKRKGTSKGNDIGKYAVAFAVGLGLAGAGLLLGWTMGWLLPAF